MGTVLGIAAVVATIGLATTTAAQVSSQFDALRATTVIVVDQSRPALLGDRPAYATSVDARGLDRIRDLNGVRAVGATQPIGDVLVAGKPTASGGGGVSLPVLAADPGALRALEIKAGSGRVYDEFHEDRHALVALVGRVAAERLGVVDVAGQRALWIAGRPLTVIGIVDEVPRRPSVVLGIVLPRSTVLELFDASRLAAIPEEVVVRTDPGAASVIAAQSPVALRPGSPGQFLGLAPPDPRDLREDVEADVDALLLLVGAVALVVGAVGILNAASAAVIERTSEIGLRRAVGARRRHIALQVVVESTLTGAIGGVLGSSVGLLVVVAVARARQWTPTLDPMVPLGAPLLGVVAGLLAGLYPSWRATRLEPSDALRR